MRTTRPASWRRIRRCALLATWVAVVPATSRPVEAAEIIPSVGVTKSTRSGGESARVHGGLALRGSLVPFVQSEIGVAYRRETRSNGDLDVTMWPVTASLWLTPIPRLYAGGGVGWYHTTLTFRNYEEWLAQWADVPPQSTRQEFGMHVGGGVTVPLTGSTAVDLNGRYVFLDTQVARQNPIPPIRFDPDYGSTTLGLAIRF